MDSFCGDIRNAWGISAAGYLTHCFDDLILFGTTYVFIFIAGSYRAWTLLHIPTVDEFPYSTRHSVKVMVLGWLGLFPMIIFACKYANGVHDDFEWVAKPLASLAWLYSLWILNMEVARDLKECWVLKTFWGSSAAAATVALPTVVIAAETNGYGTTFYAYLLHYLLYLVMAVLTFRFGHQSKREVPEWKILSQQTGKGDDETAEIELAHLGFLSVLWRDRLWRLLTLFSPDKFLLGAAFLCLCIGVPLSALATVVIGRMFNNFYYPYAPDSARGHLREYCLFVVLIYALSSALEAGYSTLVFIAGERMASRTRRKLFHNLLRQETAFFDAVDPEELGKVLKIDVAVVHKTLGDHLFHGLHCILNILVALSIMFLISWKMALVVLSLAPICILVMKVQRYYARKLGKERNWRLSAASAFMHECLASLRIVRSFASEDQQIEKYKDYVADVYEISFQSGLVDATSKSSATLIVQFSVALSLYVGGVSVLSRQVEVGYLISFSILSILAVSSMGQLSPLVRQITKALKSSDALFSFLDRIPDLPSSGTQVLDNVEGKLELQGVSFSYPTHPEREVLKDLSISFSPNSLTAVVGPRGSGKTSVMHLIQRLYEPTQGSIFLDGSQYSMLDQDWLREKVAVVHEDPVLFAMSIAQNIAYTLDTATQAQVEAAARFADAHDFIQTFPDGYQAVLGDTGVRLTATQKLQVALARAVLVPSKILILDETLEGLEDGSAQLVVENLLSEAKSRTIIIMTSAPQTLRGAAEKVWVLSGGKCVDSGTPQDLSRRSQVYQRLQQGTRHAPDSGATAAVQAQDAESMLKEKLEFGDALEEKVMMLGMPPNKLMALVEMANEIKEALTLEAQGLS